MRWICLALGVGLVGCGTFVTATTINPSPRPMRPRAPGEVEIYASSPPPRPHVDVAVLEVQQTRSLNEQGTDLMIQSLREQAGAMGCDAIFLGAMSDHQGAQPGSGWDLLDPGATIRQATCIVYRAPATTPSEDPPAAATTPTSARQSVAPNARKAFAPK
jgi:hypothetical protein